MLRATRVLDQIAPEARSIVDTITLDRQSRYRRRVLLKTDGGHDLLLDLAEATYLPDGVLLGVEGGAVRVQAAAEDLLEIHAHDARQLATIAWHIGNRHTPAEITAGAIYIQPDHVLAEMVQGLGGHVHAVRRPFEPEGGAYGGKGPLTGGHHHHGPAHEHGHDHGHEHAHGHGHRHEHGPGHQHGHAQGARASKPAPGATSVGGVAFPDQRRS